MSYRVRVMGGSDQQWVNDGSEAVEVHDSLYGRAATDLECLPESGVVCEHARELQAGDGRATFTGLYVVYRDNVAHWLTEWDIATPDKPGSGAVIEDEIGVDAPEIHDLLVALQNERFALDHPYIRCELVDKPALLRRFRLPEEDLLPSE
jgi:hypothetical protein